MKKVELNDHFLEIFHQRTLYAKEIIILVQSWNRQVILFIFGLARTQILPSLKNELQFRIVLTSSVLPKVQYNVIFNSLQHDLGVVEPTQNKQ